MRKLLTIGEAARLLGVTPKTVRHYHGIGLLAEPERSEAGYRLYGAGELLRLTRIRRLRSLGLSLKQVALVLGEPGRETPLREVLEGLLGEVEAEIGALQERRRRLAELLAGEDLEASEPSPTFEMFKERLAERLPGVSAETWEQGGKFWAALDAYKWPEGYGEVWEAIARYYAERPEEYGRLAAFEEQFAALADEPEDSPEVERLARRHARLLESNPGLAGLFEQTSWAGGPFGNVMAEIMAANLSPAQRRLFELIEERETRAGRDEG